MADPSPLAALAQSLGIDPTSLPAASAPAPANPGARLVPFRVRNPEPAPLKLTNVPANALDSLAREHLAQVRQPDLRPADDVFLEIRRMADPEFIELAQKMVTAGLLDEDYTREEVEKAWLSLVDKAADWYASRPDTAATPLDMLDVYYKTAPGSVAPGETPGTRTRDVVNRRLELATNDQARALLSGMMQKEIGRRPTEKEVDDFQAVLNQAQSKNPYVTTTTSTLDGAGNVVGSSATTTGGFDDTGFAEEFVAGDRSLESEYGMYQASTLYMSALMQALEGPVGM